MDEILIPSRDGMLSIKEFGNSYQVIYFLEDDKGFLVIEDLMVMHIEYVDSVIENIVG